MSDEETKSNGALTLRIPPAMWPLIFALTGGTLGAGGVTFAGQQARPEASAEHRHEVLENTVGTMRDNQLLICQSLDVECER